MKLREGLGQAYVRAYSTFEALHVGFEWYRAFPQDEKDNLGVRDVPVQTPVLCIRGDHEGDLQPYVEGLRESGLHNVQGRAIPDSGHFAPDEQPAEVVRALREFIFDPW
jgi:pimeloyl-ACP methyl ester carboxylesterase